MGQVDSQGVEIVNTRGITRSLTRLARELVSATPEWPSFELDGLWDDGLRLKTTFTFDNPYLKGASPSDVDLGDMKDDVSDEAGRVFESLKPTLEKHGLSIIPGSGATTSLYNPNRSRVEYPFLAEVKLRKTGLDIRRLENELKRALR